MTESKSRTAFRDSGKCSSRVFNPNNAQDSIEGKKWWKIVNR